MRPKLEEMAQAEQERRQQAFEQHQQSGPVADGELHGPDAHPHDLPNAAVRHAVDAEPFRRRPGGMQSQRAPTVAGMTS